MPELNTQLRHNPIAIVGMGAIMPEARNLREYWNNIIGGVDCIVDVPASRWKIDDYYDPDPSVPDKTYCKRGGFLPEVDFDPMEFGLPPNILEVTDVSQMLSLLVAKEALLNAGYLKAADEIRDRTGVILGVGGGQKLITPLTARLQYPMWDEVLKSYGIDDENRAHIIDRMKKAYIRWEENSFPGMLGNVIAGRIANRFDLGGTNCVVDAACASTMAAMKMALSELTEHRADMMITGGVDTDNSIFMYMCFSKTPAFSKGDNPRPFDTESDGMMVGEGIGMMVLKRLEDAKRDGDQIYAVIKGLGSSSDGRFKSIYAPRGEGQEKALRRAYEDAGFSPSTVGLVEAHGTGTIAGDTTEVTTAVRYFNQHDTQKQHIALGSVKSQIGHAKAAAGVAGMIKVALALHHKVLPPTLNVDEPNPKFDITNSAFYISTEARPWIRGADAPPRRAGVSSFGFGGTNFHVVMEEYTEEQRSAYRIHNTPQSVVLNAGTPAELRNTIAQTITQLQGADGETYFLNLVKQTQETAIPQLSARVGFVTQNAAEAVALLQIAETMLGKQPDAEEWQHPKGVFYRRSSMNVNGRVVALFSGQGSQYLNMGRELALNFPDVRDSFGRLDALMQREGKRTLSDVVYPKPSFNEAEKDSQDAALQSTDYAQPAIGAVSAGLYRMLTRAGFQANFTAGHSFGEVSALWAAGALSDDDYYTLVKARGAAMAPPPNDSNFDAGTMLAVTGDVDAIEREVAAIPNVQVANRNSRTQVVVAGAKDAIKNAENLLAAKGFRVIPLSVSAAFHTPLVGHAQRPFAQAINNANFMMPTIPVYSNATGQAYPQNPASMKQMLTEHILQPVLFRDEIENIYAAGGTVFVEFGPRNVLTNLVKDILGDRPHIAIALNASRQKDSDRQLREAIVQLQVLGLNIGAIDPYVMQDKVEEPATKKKLNVKLTGASYVSEKTRNEYQQALAEGAPAGFQIGTASTSAAPVVQAPPPVAAPAPVQTPATPEPQPDPQPLTYQDTQEASADMSTILQALEGSLAQFREHQRETLRVHEQYTQNQAEYFRIFFELTQKQHTLMSSQSLPPNAIDAMAQNMARFHEYQAETLRMHERYMQQQTEIGQSLLAMIGQQYGGLANMPVKMNGASGNNGASAFTPAPQPTYTASVSTPTPTPTPTPAPTPALVAAPPAPVVQPVAQAVPAPTPALAMSAAPNGVDINALSEAMLRIVGDKTGYPVEMLELSMDMEADLGIDSIKRVEILGAMRDEFPNLPQFSPEELGELRTLQQIVDYMQERSGGSALPVVSPPAPAPTPAPAPQPVAQSAPQAAPQAVPSPSHVQTTVPASNGTASSGTASGVSIDALSEAMLRIVGDKTGYPVDMLELSMDMEADLGIDSIKRVEILGAMRDEFPNLPQFSPEELGELRTLQQIVDYMQERAGGSAAPATPAPAPAAPQPTAAAQPVTNGNNGAVQAAPVAVTPAPANNVNVAALSEAMLRIVGDKTGYPVDMLELSMDMEADLGIDSIKRVEILGAMRDEFPNLPQFSPEELGELRTLQQIVDYMEGASRQASPFDQDGSAVTPADVVLPSNAGLPFDTQGIERSVVTVRRLPTPDFMEVSVNGAVALMTDDGTAATATLAQQLTNAGWRVVVLSLPEALIPANTTLQNVTRFILPDLTEATLQNTLMAITGQYGEIGAFIHMNPTTTSQNGTLFYQNEKAIVKFVFLMAKHLKPHLTQGNAVARKSFIAVTRLDGVLGTRVESNYGTISGGLFGLVKTLNLEWDSVFCRAVDVTPHASSEQVAHYIYAEMHDPNRLLTEVAYGSQGRTTLTTQQPHTTE